MEERDARWSRAAQVGMLMRAYRESFQVGENKHGLTQAALLDRMSTVNNQYAERYSHVTVSRWETGSTLPTVERLLDFGKALNLAEVEVEGLMRLAGFHTPISADDRSASAGWNDPEIDGNSRSQPTGVSQCVRAAYVSNGRRSEALVPDIGSIIRYVSFKCVLTGAAIAVLGYTLAAYGWDTRWMPLAYVTTIMCLVLAEGLLHRRRPHDLGEWYSATIFFLLSTFLLQSAFTQMDPYGLYAIDGFAGTHVPLLLALEINLVLACVAGLGFHLLRQRIYSGDTEHGNPLRRAAYVAVPPALLVYASILVISNLSLWAQLVMVIPAVAAVYVTLLALRDPLAKPVERDRRLLLVAAISLAGVLGTLGIGVVVALYVYPDVPSVFPDHNLFATWEIDYAKLGYSEKDALGRLNQGYLWHGLATFAFMILGVGGYLINGIRQIGRDEFDTAMPDFAASPRGAGRLARLDRLARSVRMGQNGMSQSV